MRFFSKGQSVGVLQCLTATANSGASRAANMTAGRGNCSQGALNADGDRELELLPLWSQDRLKKRRGVYGDEQQQRKSRNVVFGL